jgi:hypothetical protein
LFDLDEAIVNAARTRNRAALTAYKALRKRARIAMARPGGRRGRALNDRELYELMRMEIRERKDSNEFIPPSNDEYLLNREVIAVLTAQLSRVGPTRRRER